MSIIYVEDKTNSSGYATIEKENKGSRKELTQSQIDELIKAKAKKKAEKPEAPEKVEKTEKLEDGKGAEK